MGFLAIRALLLVVHLLGPLIFENSQVGVTTFKLSGSCPVQKHCKGLGSHCLGAGALRDDSTDLPAVVRFGERTLCLQAVATQEIAAADLLASWRPYDEIDEDAP